MSLNQETVTEAIKTVIDPNTGKDLVSGRCVRNLVVSGADVRFEVELGYPARSQHELIRGLLTAALAHLLIKLLEDALCETAYLAEVAGLHYGIWWEGGAGEPA